MKTATTAKKAWGVVAVATALVLSGCGALHPEDFPISGPTPSATSSNGNVTKEQLGSSWPLEIDSGDVACVVDSAGDASLTFTTPDGERYALNRIAEKQYPPLSEIAPQGPGPLISYALGTCDTD